MTKIDLETVTEMLERLRGRKVCVGFRSGPSEDGGHSVLAAQYGPDPQTNAAADMLEALAARVAELEAAQSTCAEISQDVPNNAKSDAQGFEGNLWKDFEGKTWREIPISIVDWSLIGGGLSRAEAAEAKLAAKDAEVGKLRDALTGIKRAGKGRMASYGDEHSYYYFTASAALQETEK